MCLKTSVASKKPNPKVTLCAYLRGLLNTVELPCSFSFLCLSWLYSLFIFLLRFYLLLPSLPHRFLLIYPFMLVFPWIPSFVFWSLYSPWTISIVFSSVNSLCLAQADWMDPSLTLPLHLVVRFTLAHDSFILLHDCMISFSWFKVTVFESRECRFPSSLPLCLTQCSDSINVWIINKGKHRL